MILALDVPKRLIHAGDCAHHHRAAAIEAGTKQRLPDILDLQRIPAQKIIAHILHGAAHGARLPFHDRFSPANVSRVRGDLQKQPARWNRE